MEAVSLDVSASASVSPEPLYESEPDDRTDRRAAQRAARSLAATVAKLHGALPLPVAAQRLLAATQSTEYKLSEVVRIIESDPALAARIMRQATSALLGRVRCTSIAQAVTRLGARMLQATAIAATAIDLFGQDEPSAQLAVRHANTTAAIARFLSRHCGLVPEEMYTCGLLHDIGKLMLLRGADLDYHELLDTNAGPDQIHLAERERYGFDHAVLAGHVLTSWKLPHPLPRVVAWHHQPRRAYRTKGQIARMVALVRAADQLTYPVTASSLDPGALVQSLSEELEILGLSQESFGALCGEVADEIEREAEAMGTQSQSRLREARSSEPHALGRERPGQTPPELPAGESAPSSDSDSDKEKLVRPPEPANPELAPRADTESPSSSPENDGAAPRTRRSKPKGRSARAKRSTARAPTIEHEESQVPSVEKRIEPRVEAEEQAAAEGRAESAAGGEPEEARAETVAVDEERAATEEADDNAAGGEPEEERVDTETPDADAPFPDAGFVETEHSADEGAEGEAIADSGNAAIADSESVPPIFAAASPAAPDDADSADAVEHPFGRGEEDSHPADVSEGAAEEPSEVLADSSEDSPDSSPDAAEEAAEARQHSDGDAPRGGGGPIQDDEETAEEIDKALSGSSLSAIPTGASEPLAPDPEGSDEADRSTAEPTQLEHLSPQTGEPQGDLEEAPADAQPDAPAPALVDRDPAAIDAWFSSDRATTEKSTGAGQPSNPDTEKQAEGPHASPTPASQDAQSDGAAFDARYVYAMAGVAFFIGSATGRFAAVLSDSVPGFLAFALVLASIPSAVNWALDKFRRDP